MMDIKKMREHALEKTKEKLQQKLIRRDNAIVQAVRSVDVIDKGSNLLIEQLKDWYALYFPELARMVEDNDEYLRIVAEIGEKKNYNESKLVNAVGRKGYIDRVIRASRDSMGAELKPGDIKEVQDFASKILELRKDRTRIDQYLEIIMKEEAPNISAIIGSTIGARLIAIAGSLERLASMPSSTVQVLGAEKALFSHLQRGTLPPKYGIIFQFPKLRGAPKKVRGKIARKIAAKVSIAAKLDFYKGEFKGKQMGEILMREIDSLVK